MSTAALELVKAIEANGGRLTVERDHLVIEPRKAGLPLLEQLRAHKPEIIALLQSPGIPPGDPAGWFVNGERVTVFPHCPRCASYALYRKDNQGDYECLTCGMQGIEESRARRVQ